MHQLGTGSAAELRKNIEHILSARRELYNAGAALLECDDTYAARIKAELERLEFASHFVPFAGIPYVRRVSADEIQSYLEGEYQHNCVFSRRELLRKDKVSIYRWNHKGSSYTVQFVRRLSGEYVVNEVRARFNHAITKEDFDDFRAHLSGIAIIGNDVRDNL